MKTTETTESSWLDHARATAHLAGPVVAGQVGLMLMALVDTLFMGALGDVAVGAVGVGTSAIGVFFMFGLGLLLGLDRTAAIAVGAGRPEELRSTMWQGILLATAASIPLTLGGYAIPWLFPAFKIAPTLLPEAQTYTKIVALSLPPSLLFIAVRQVLQAKGDTLVANGLLLTANGINALANWVFVFGHWGMPPLGVAGSAWATVCARTFSCVGILWWARQQGLLQGPFVAEKPLLKELFRLGIPSGLQLVLEGGVFTLSTILAAGISAESAAAHQVVLQLASFTFMVPLGISAAGTIRVGLSLGRNEFAEARRAGFVALALSVGFMCCSATTLVTCSRWILRPFELDAPAFEIAVKLLYCAGLFQFFDGAQVTLAGLLRGYGDTVASLGANLVGHWLLGLPVGYFLAFFAGFGVVGLWLGLATGLSSVALFLFVLWLRRSQTAQEKRVEKESSSNHIVP